MWVLREGPEPDLDETQQGLLLAIFTSADPRQAWDISEGTNQLVSTRKELGKMFYITGGNGQATVTSNGVYALKRLGLIADNNQPTPQGKKLLSMLQTNKQEQINLESLTMIKSFYP